MARRTGSRDRKTPINLVTQIDEVDAGDILRAWGRIASSLKAEVDNLQAMVDRHPRQAIEALLEAIREARDNVAYWERVTAEHAVLLQGTTQKAVAETLHISTQTIGRWVREPTTFTLDE